MRRYVVPLVIAAGMIVMLVSLLLLSKSTANSADFEQMHDGLLVVNAVAVLVLVAVIGWNLARLVLQYRRNVTGSRLTTRLVVMFVLLAIVPVVLVYYFSVQFISRGIDSWFDVRVERALQDAIELSRSALQLRVRELLARTEQIGNTLAVTSPDNSAQQLDLLRRRSGATQLTLLSGMDGHIIATSSALSAQLIPDLPGEQLLMQVRSGGVYVG
ncbi:MAG TPA: two-component sensor histidine kinase, partial [Gammaproteobacteria bacterium]|nr:two-component sensor histidine kinase [Gammaproteobacteria bacterium]